MATEDHKFNSTFLVLGRKTIKKKNPSCCVQGGWDTSGSELSEGELEKRRRTLLEQLDAP